MQRDFCMINNKNSENEEEKGPEEEEVKSRNI